MSAAPSATPATTSVPTGVRQATPVTPVTRVGGRPLVRLLRIVAPFVALGLVWTLAKLIWDLEDNVLPSVGTVAGSLGDLTRRGILGDYAASSLTRLAGATVLAVVVAVPVGVLLGLNRWVAIAFEPFLRFFQAVSGIAWLPLLIVWYGMNDTTIRALILYTLCIPIVFNTMLGVRSVPVRYRDMCRSLGAGWPRVLRDVYLPGALPHMIVGLRLGLAYGFRALIAGEMVIGRGGLGDLVFAARTGNQTERIVAGMIVIGLLYLVIDRLLLQPLEDLTVGRWGVLRS